MTRHSRRLLERAHVLAGEIRYAGKETDRKREEGDEISILEFATFAKENHDPRNAKPCYHWPRGASFAWILPADLRR
jgi:hypothetical protein